MKLHEKCGNAVPDPVTILEKEYSHGLSFGPSRN